MPRYKLTLEYTGTRYSGWQVQKNARTVQGELHRAIAVVVGGPPLELYGSGRTDAGVHALGQVAHVELLAPMPPDVFRLKVNDELPSDVHVLAVQPVGRRFHARHGAVSRSYVYQISRRRTALAKPFVWWIKDDLDVRRMAEAAALFRGMHDFQSFTDLDPEEGSTRVLLEGCEVAEEGALVLVRVVGSHFLWKMVRRLVGVLAGVGRGTVAIADVAGFLNARSGVPAQLTAPPSGLFLEGVYYEGDAGPPALRAAVPVPVFTAPRAASGAPALETGRRRPPRGRRP
jgi:tRNA pseudouridine38-40 synthase